MTGIMEGLTFAASTGTMVDSLIKSRLRRNPDSTLVSMALTLPEQITAAIRRSRHLLVTFPKHYTLDAVASATALALLLRRMDKVFDVAADGYPADPPYSFLAHTEILPALPAAQQLLVTVQLDQTELEQFSYDVRGDVLTVYLTPKAGLLPPTAVSAKTGDFRYDCIVTLNAPDLASLGTIYTQQRELFEKTPIINLDTQAANEHYGHINLVDLTAAATAEIISDLAPAFPPAGTPNGNQFDREVATALLAGLIGATRSFQTGRATAKTLKIASDLVAAGGNRDGIVKALYQSHSVTALKLWGKTLTRLHSDLNGKLVWAAVPEADFLDAGATMQDLPGLTDALLTYLPSAEIAVLLAQQGNDVAVRITSLRNLSALQLARPFAVQGDQRVATGLVSGQNLPEVERTVIATVRDNLQRLLP